MEIPQKINGWIFQITFEQGSRDHALNSSRFPSRLDRPPVLVTHKCRGSIVVLSISKSVEPNEEQKEMISGFQ